VCSEPVSLKDVPVLLLVGGQGKRLRAVVAGKPKPLALVGERPFLELLAQQFRQQGVRSLVMCTGYLADQVEAEIGDGAAFGLTIAYSREECPHGTAGAIKLAHGRISGCPEFIVTNGDSILDVSFSKLLGFHRKAGALVTIAAVRVENGGRYGIMQLRRDGQVIGFAEKSGVEGPGLINGGVYVFSRDALQFLPDGPGSLEREVFPRLIGKGLYAFEQKGFFIDIGTPEDYERASQFYDRLQDAAEGRRSILQSGQ
jgi:D-glycero-alpha-D-manno-heptose 1-phosphate guanylyltransferase